MQQVPFRKLTRFAAGSALAFAAAASAQSPRDPGAPPPPPPPAVATQPPRAASDMQAVLDQLQALGAKPFEQLTPAQARTQPTPADAVKAVMAKRGMPTAPDPAVTTQDMPYGSDPLQFVRVYRPAAARTGTPLPVIVYWHGGGWVLADVNVYDAAPRTLSKELNALVMSVEYRKGPEAKFPSQHEDAVAAYRYVLANAGRMGGDPARMAFAGESAGGNLAVATAIFARDNGLPAPRHILSVYPIANPDPALPSKRDSANAKPLGAAALPWFGHYYSRTAADQQDPRVNLVRANLSGLPPTTIVNAQIDPLRSDGETLARAMRAAGVRVEQRTFPGVAHEMFGMGKVVRGAMDANTYAVTRLRAALAAGPARAPRR